MSFDPTRYRLTVDAVSAGVEELRALVDRLAGLSVEVAAPEPVRKALVWCVDELVQLTTDMLDTTAQLLRGAAAPLLFFHTAYRWQELRGTATDVVGALNPSLMPATGVWSGDAAAAYGRAGKPQSDAAARIGTVADKVSVTLLASASAGLTFYVALGIILAKVVAAAVAALAAFGTAALAPVGVAIVLEEAAVTPALLTAAVGALVAALGVQAAGLVVLHGEAEDRAAFPGGTWPTATADRYADATVTDGDADWSLGS
jgi:hypothetical protein